MAIRQFLNTLNIVLTEWVKCMLLHKLNLGQHITFVPSSWNQTKSALQSLCVNISLLERVYQDYSSDSNTSDSEHTKHLNRAVIRCNPRHLYRVCRAAGDSNVGRCRWSWRSVQHDAVWLGRHDERVTAMLVRYHNDTRINCCAGRFNQFIHNHVIGYCPD